MINPKLRQLVQEAKSQYVRQYRQSNSPSGSQFTQQESGDAYAAWPNASQNPASDPAPGVQPPEHPNVDQQISQGDTEEKGGADGQSGAMGGSAESPPQNPRQAASGNTSFNGAVNVYSENYINPNAISRSQEEDQVEDTKSKSLARIPNEMLKNSTTDWEPINFRGVDEEYDLYEMSSVAISFNEESQKLMYQISEPELTEEEQSILEELKKGFIYVFEKSSPEFMNMTGKNLVYQGARKLCSKYRIKVSDDQFNRITYYLVRDFLGLEMIEPILHDPYIEDISCDGLNVPIFVNHLKYGPLEVNRSYDSTEKLNSFIVKLAQRSNQEVSLSKPILQGALPDGSRVEAIYGKEVSEKGSSFTIRKFREEPFTPVHIIDFGTMPSFVLAYLWLAIENKQSVLVSGGTATGKTTILNALSLFAPPTSKIVSIEDTPEINLPHEHWLSLIARESEGKSQVSMFDLLKASLRERPEYIIVGEIRGSEASILFQGMATGHAGLGTVHAEKFEDLVNRMTIAPINLPSQLLTELDLVVFMRQIKVKDNMVRRCTSLVELIGYSSKHNKFQTNEFVTFNPQNDEFEFTEQSAVISHLIELRGGKEDSVWKEIERRRRILDYMRKNRIMEFREVSDVIKAYYQSPGTIFEFIDKYMEKKEEGKDPTKFSDQIEEEASQVSKKEGEEPEGETETSQVSEGQDQGNAEDSSPGTKETETENVKENGSVQQR